MRVPALALLAVLAGCVAGPSMPDGSVDDAPAAPVLDPLPAEVQQAAAVITGTAPAGTTVRLYVDDACAGPVFVVTTAEDLAAGLPVELVREADSVFTADAVSPAGARSACSAPVRTYFHIPGPPLPPTIASVTPSGPTQSEDFVVRGDAPGATQVRVWLGTCGDTLAGTIAPGDFADAGFQLHLDVCARTYINVDAVDGASKPSNCGIAAVALQCDRDPPPVQPTLLSPTPAPETSAWLSVGWPYLSADVVNASFFPNDTCTAPPFAQCAGSACTAVEVEFPPNATTPWSVQATDAAGNVSTCVPGDLAWTNDPLAPPSRVELAAPTSTSTGYAHVTGRVPTGRIWVRVYTDDTCSTLSDSVPSRTFAVYGLTLRADAGSFLTATATFPDGGPGDCSAPVLVP